MSQPFLEGDSSHEHVLQCMEIWNGNQSVESIVSSPGMDVWIFSRPYLGQLQGGDVHYLSLCVGGIITRILLADVAGHGDEVADTSQSLRQLLRRFMNAKKQNRLVSELNRQFTELESQGRFATAVVATFLSHKSKLLLTNAGHPHPLFYQRVADRWVYLNDSMLAAGNGDNLPFGLDGSSTYQHFVISVEPGDWLLLYTDSLTEAFNQSDEQLGEEGLMDLVQSISKADSVASFGKELYQRVQAYSETVAESDDTTLIAIRFTKDRRKPGITERLRGYSKLFY
jgi:serine phosphatase RsbU (regulator of sigma subunit)